MRQNVGRGGSAAGPNPSVEARPNSHIDHPKKPPLHRKQRGATNTNQGNCNRPDRCIILYKTTVLNSHAPHSPAPHVPRAGVDGTGMAAGRSRERAGWLSLPG